MDDNINIRDEKHPFWNLVYEKRNKINLAFLSSIGKVMFFFGSLMVLGNKGGSAPSVLHMDKWLYWTIAIALTLIAMLFIKLGGKRGQKTAQEVLSKDTRPPVLYLRTFNDDFVTGDLNFSIYTMQSLDTEEKLVVDSFQMIGPVLAIGKPNEHLPEIGAARFYTTDENWKSAIELLAKECNLVLIRLGRSDGLNWELNHILKLYQENAISIVFIIPKAWFEDGNDKTVFDILGFEVKENMFDDCGFRTIQGLIFAQNGEKSYFQSLHSDFDITKMITHIEHAIVNRKT